MSTNAPNTQIPEKLRLGLKSVADFFAPPVPPHRPNRHVRWLESIRDNIYKIAANFRLRTKFLLSFVVITTALMCVTLLVVGHEARTQVERQIEEQSGSAVLTFQVMQHQHQIALSHKAELLATLAVLRDGDPTAVSDASEDPWQSEDCNLFMMTDAKGKVVALHTSVGNFPAPEAEHLLQQALRSHADSSWWVAGTQLYQVVVHPVIAGPQQDNAHLGTVVVGREIDPNVANELRRISSSEVAFRRGDRIVVSTFSPLEEHDLERQVGTGTVPTQLEVEGEKYITASLNLSNGVNAKQAVSLIVLRSYDGAIAFLARLDRLLIALLIVAVVAGAVLVLFTADTFTRPLKALVGGVRALEQGDFAYPLQARGGDEVAEVTRAFGRMRTTLQSDETERRKLEEQLRRAQRMEAMGRLAGGVAHDFNNLLTVIKGHSDYLLGKLPADAPLRSSGEQIAKAADRAASLTRQLLIFSRRQATQPRVLDLNAVVSEMGKLLNRLIREDITFTFRPGESIGNLRADPCHVEQVVMNLVVNACDAMPSGGRLTIDTYDFDVDEKFALSHAPLKTGEYVVLAVIDTGCGMDENTKAHIFEPFFTTKTEGKGTGLGLATVYGAVKQSNGFVWVESEVGKGTRFEVYLPRVEEPVDLIFTAKRILEPPKHAETILIVEDENLVRELASEFARSAGYTVLAAADGLSALAMAQSSTQPVHLLLTDIVLPHVHGPQLAQSLREHMPGLKVVFMSGYMEYEKDPQIAAAGNFFLPKPFTRDALIEKLEEALSKGAPIAPAFPAKRKSASSRESNLARAIT